MVFQYYNQNDLEQNDINPGTATSEKPYLPTEGDNRTLGLSITTKKVSTDKQKYLRFYLIGI